MDWDWHLIVEIATLIVASIGTLLILGERVDRRRRRGLATQPLPRWRVVDAPRDGVLPIEISNQGGAAPACCVIVQVDDRLYAGNFALADRQTWEPHTLTQFDTIPDRSAAPYPLVCVASDALGYWSASGPNVLLDGLVAGEVPAAVARLLRRAIGRQYLCTMTGTGQLEIRSALQS
ncbi:MAG TPA: hypothetical protein VND88_12680 [Candidatus Acidoferrales bacterium]|nr:hypothetical protein [Candidatus Acidoferrales bacterium]